MKNVIKTVALSSLLTLGFMTQAPVVMAACDYKNLSSEPTSAQRTVEGDGFTFSLPVNYRAQLLTDGSIFITNPDTFQYLECAKREGIRTDNYSGIHVSTSYTTMYESITSMDSRFTRNIDVTYDVLPDGRAMALVSAYWNFYDTTVVTYYEEMPDGRTVEVTVPLLGGGEHKVFSTIFTTLYPN